MENTTTTTTTTKEEKVYTLNDIKDAMSAADNARNNTGSIFAKEYLDTMDAMNDAFKGYNDKTRAAAFDEMATLKDVFTRRQYSALHAQKDSKSKGFKAVSRSVRFSTSEFINYKKEKGMTVENGDKYTTALKGLTTALMRFIQSEVTYDNNGGKKSVPVSVPVAALKAVMDTIGIDNVIARNRDVRFLAFTCTGGTGTIGALRDVSSSKVEAMLMDVYHVQMNGLKYEFETQGKDDKPALAPAKKSGKKA